jgi:hypothetical protein
LGCSCALITHATLAIAMKLAYLAVFLIAPILAQEPEENIPTFGVSVLIPLGLTGQIYKLKPNADDVPNFKKLKPIGTIYTQSLAIQPRSFSEGFPGVTDVFEWFAIDYTGRFWIETPGEYNFFLTSDDGSRLYIDGKKIVDNDGVHPAEEKEGKIKLKQGVHEIRVQYFQGPRFHVALILEVLPPEGARKIFSTLDFKPPPGFEDFNQLSEKKK